MVSARTLGLVAFTLFAIGNLLATGAILPSAEVQSDPEPDLRSWMIALPQDVDSEPEVFQIGPLEDGEMRQFFTSAGVEIAVSRKGDGRQIKVNGEELETHINHTALVVSADDDADHEHKTIHIRKKHVTHDEDVEIEHVEIDEDSEDHEVHKEHAVQVIMKKTHERGIHVNTITTGASGLQLVIVDRLHVHRK